MNDTNTDTSLASVSAIPSANLPLQIFDKLAKGARIEAAEKGINVRLNYWTGLKFRSDHTGQGRLVVKANVPATLEAVVAWFKERGQPERGRAKGQFAILFLDGSAALLLPEMIQGLAYGGLTFPMNDGPQAHGWGTKDPSKDEGGAALLSMGGGAAESSTSDEDEDAEGDDAEEDGEEDESDDEDEDGPDDGS